MLPLTPPHTNSLSSIFLGAEPELLCKWITESVFRYYGNKSGYCCCSIASVMSDSLPSHGPQTARTLCPRDFPRQECWSGLPCPAPGDLPDPGIELVSPALQADSLLLSHWGSPDKSGYDIEKGHWTGFCWRRGSDSAHGRSGAWIASWSWSHFVSPYIGQSLATGCSLFSGGLILWAKQLPFGHGQFWVGGGICKLFAMNIHPRWGMGCTSSVNGMWIGHH